MARHTMGSSNLFCTVKAESEKMVVTRYPEKPRNSNREQAVALYAV